ncbi:MAG: hypothetical protein WA584_14065 [Pyrinomonadaceae bacterium]
MEKHKGPMPESVRNFWRVVVKGSISGEGEDIIDSWENNLENYDENGDGDYLGGIYKLTEEDMDEIREIIAEYRLTREQEEAEREKRRLAQQKADEVMAKHYADRIKKIVKSKPNKFLPKPRKLAAAPRRRGN